jgi:hypothetical protein
MLCLLDAEWLDHSRLHARKHLLGVEGRCAEVTLEQHGHTFRLIADVRNGRGAGDAWHYESALRVELGVAHPTIAAVNHQWTTWAFDDTLQRDGLLRDAASWLSSELWGDEATEPAIEAHPPDGDDVLEIRQTRTELELACEGLGRLALAHADEAALETARTLTHDVQFFAYSALLDDPNDRVRELIATCPALLSLASGLSPHVGDGAELVRGIRAGRKLNRLLTDMLLVATRRFRGAVDGELSRALVRNAPSLPLRDLMHALCAPGIDINDLHASAPRRTSWFDTVIVWGQVASRIRDRDAAVQLGSFISKHAVGLSGNPAMTISAIVDWVARSGAAVPSRRTSPERVRREIDSWHEALFHIDNDPATRLAPPPTSQHVVPGLAIEPLLTVGDLITEGQQMRHCVASLAPDAIAGWVSVFRATVSGTRVTIAAVRECGAWGLMEAAGFANAPLDTGRLDILRYWVESLR